MIAVVSAGEEWLHRLVDDLLEQSRLARLVEYVCDRIVADVPEIGASDLRAALAAATTELGRVMLPGLRTGRTPVELPGAAHEFTELLVRGGADLTVLLRVCRSGQHAVHAALSEQIGRSNLDDAEARLLILRVVTYVTEWAGTATEILSVRFLAERNPEPPGLRAHRRETVRAILAGAFDDLGTAETRLGYALDGFHTALVLWVDTAQVEPGRLEQDARRLGAAVTARGVLTLERGARTVWAWIRTPHRFDLAAPGSGAITPGVRVAAGLPRVGVDGFRRSHGEALAAQRIARLTADRRPVTGFADIELEHLIGHDAAALRSFTDRTLGALAESGATRLRETLGVYLREQCGIEATARTLGVHRNTVRYRLDQIEQLLGHDIGGRRLELEVALRCSRTFAGAPDRWAAEPRD
ncbi:helix-turn-helix domain-containing protein [Nocardia sp. NPDC048505]|uniref:PucR family transcriptional regulator n=1 Tax=unclassified Nocardia TaxID=2637762 RepID=UPI003405E938